MRRRLIVETSADERATTRTLEGDAIAARRTPQNRWVQTGLTAAMMLVLSACSGGVDGQGQSVDASPWEPPGWMAEQARQQEEFQAALQSCLDGAGWDKTVTPDGGIKEPFTGAEYDRFRENLHECYTQMGYPVAPTTTLSPEFLGTLYDRQLDVAACLKSKGEEVSDPPTRDLYIETANDPESTAGWSPYDVVLASGIGEEEYNALRRDCPEPWFPPQ